MSKNGVKEKPPDKEDIKELMTMWRMVEAIEEWEEGDQLLCMDDVTVTIYFTSSLL